MSDVIDLLESDEEVPSLAARLQKKGAALPNDCVVKHAPPAAQPIAAATARQQASRPPLSPFQSNRKAGSPQGDTKLSGPAADTQPWEPSSQKSGDLLAGAEALRRRMQARAARNAAAKEAAAAQVAASAALVEAAPAAWQAEPPQPQYHQRPEWQEQPYSQGLEGSQAARGHGGAAAAAAAVGRRQRAAASPRRQEEQPRLDSQPQLDSQNWDWQLPGGSQLASQPASQRAAALGGGEEPPAKKQRRPKRTEEEKQRDDALKVGICT